MASARNSTIEERKIIRTESFTSSFFQHIQDTKNAATFSDFLIKVKGQELPCHKLVLSANSEYFSTLFSEPDMKEVQQGFVELDTLDFTALKKCLMYCYSGEIDLCLDGVKDLVQAAEHLQMLPLKSHLSTFIVDNQTSQNCIAWYFYAETYALPEVQEKARQVMITEFCDVVRTPEFLDLTHTQMIDYIREADADPDVSLEAAVRWITHDKEDRQIVLEEVLKIVELKKCSPGLLKHILENYADLVTQFDMLHQITMAALTPVRSLNPHTDDMDHDFYILAGMFREETLNSKSWLMNLKSGSVCEKASIPEALQNTIVAATCDTPRGMLFMRGYEGFYVSLDIP